MGEYPPLSEQEIVAIGLQRLSLESGLSLESITVTIEHPAT